MSPQNGVFSYFVVDVSGTLRRHLLDYVDRVSIVPADLLVVRAVGRVGRPQRDDDVAGFRAIVIGAGDAASAASFRAGQGGQGQWRVVGVRVLGMASSVAHHADDGSDQQEEGGPPGSPRDQSDVGRLEGPVPTIVEVGSSGLGVVA